MSRRKQSNPQQVYDDYESKLSHFPGAVSACDPPQENPRTGAGCHQEMSTAMDDIEFASGAEVTGNEDSITAGALEGERFNEGQRLTSAGVMRPNCGGSLEEKSMSNNYDSSSDHSIATAKVVPSIHLREAEDDNEPEFNNENDTSSSNGEHSDSTEDQRLAFHERMDVVQLEANSSRENGWQQVHGIDQRNEWNGAASPPTSVSRQNPMTTETDSLHPAVNGPDRPSSEHSGNTDMNISEESVCPENPPPSAHDAGLMHSPHGGDEEQHSKIIVDQDQNARDVKSVESDDESRELNEIKDQVRMLQQQQMYQVQMLNFLHLQLTVIASNPQGARNQPPMFPPSKLPGLNGFQLQNVQQLLTAAASMSGAANQAPGSSLMPSVAAAIGRHFSASNPLEAQQIDEANGACPKSLELEMNDALQQENRAGKIDHEERPLFPGNCGEQPDPSIFRRSCSMGNEPVQAMNNFASTDDSLKKRTCRFCQKVFGSESALQIHLRSHTGERPFKCNICANRFSTRGNLKVHFSRHQEKHPHIEMNANPIPEYLDNIPTSSGIPYGMSIIPEYEVEPNAALPDPVTETQIPPPLIHKSDIFPALYRPLEAPPTNVNSHKHVNRSESSQIENSENVTQPKEENPRDTNEKQKSGFPTMTLSKPNGVDHPFNPMRNTQQVSPPPSVPLPRHLSEGARASYDERRHDYERENVQNPPSETSKLQQLVDQIDKGKDLEKNECHICHRVLSCQSALKLHYRTHTGERPYKCDLCSRAFTTRGNLRTHYSSVHRQQLRSSPPTNSSVVRGSSLQCPLCGSRFMDQQSMRQHMHMHLYMHSQQQQQVAHFMNGHHNDTRFPLMIGGKYGSSGDGDEHEMRMPLNTEENNFSSKLDGDRSELNDDVFDGRSSERDTSPYDDPREEESPQSRSESEEPGPRGAYSRSLTPPSEKHHEPSARPSLGENAAENITKPLATAVSALDLTRPSSSSPEVSSASMYGATPASNSDNRRPSSHSPPQLASSSLNALAHLASNSSIMRPSGVPLMHNTADSEFRVRKMTTACEICNKPFTCQSALEIHLRIHTNERPYVCRVCERGFTTKGNLKQHLLTHNINEVGDDFLEPVDTSPIPANSTCISPSNSPALSSNSQMNARKRPSEGNEISSAAKRTYPRHWCHICQKQFSSASSLQIHNRTHTGEKPFACSVCGRAFTTKGNLKVHMGTHVWGAGGSRRGRRISMDNPLISPWMQNTSNSNGNPQNQTLRVRQTAPHIPPVADPAMIYQQYAALASGLMGAKASADSRFHANGMINLHNAAAARLLQPPSNGHVTPASAASLAQQISANNAVNSGERPNNLAAASEWIWKAYQRTQEQVN